MVLGSHMTVEQRTRLSVAHMGKSHEVSVESCVRMSVAHKGKPSSWKGKHPSLEARAKMSIAKKGKPLSPEHCAKLSAAKTGELHWRWQGGYSIEKMRGYWRKHYAKRCSLGFSPMNVPFEGCEGHHINQNDVIYIPKELHQSIRHNVWTGKNMERINALATSWLTEDWT